MSLAVTFVLQKDNKYHNFKSTGVQDYKQTN